MFGNCQPVSLLVHLIDKMDFVLITNSQWQRSGDFFRLQILTYLSRNDSVTSFWVLNLLLLHGPLKVIKISTDP